jgi:hypothetical protein
MGGSCGMQMGMPKKDIAELSRLAEEARNKAYQAGERAHEAEKRLQDAIETQRVHREWGDLDPDGLSSDLGLVVAEGCRGYGEGGHRVLRAGGKGGAAMKTIKMGGTRVYVCAQVYAYEQHSDGYREMFDITTDEDLVSIRYEARDKGQKVGRAAFTTDVRGIILLRNVIDQFLLAYEAVNPEDIAKAKQPLAPEPSTPDPED